MQILKIQPPTTSDLDQPIISQKTTNSTNQESIPATPGSTTDTDRASQRWTKQTTPTTPNSNPYRRQHNRSAFHQRSLNSSGNSSTNRSLADSPKSSNHSFMKQTRSDTNLASSPISNNSTNSVQTKSNISLTSSGIIVTDYRQSTIMKRIVNP